MNARLNKISMLVAVVGLVCLASSAFAQPPEETGQAQKINKQAWQEKKQGMADNLAKELGLTPEQEAQLKAQREQSQKENQATREQLKAKNQELRQELDKETIDEAKVNSLIGEITALEGKKLSQHVAGIISLKKILTPEQEAKLKAKRDERKERMRHKMGGARERIKEKFRPE